jgi:hypothetical protein
MAKESKVTKIRLELLGSDELDCEGRKAKPVITGHITGDELDSFVYDAPSSRDDQPAHAKFLGLLHAGRMPDLSFFLGYTAKKQRSEFVLGLDTSLKMLVGCDNLNLEVRVTMVGNTCKPGVEFVAALTHQHPLEFGTKKYKCNVWFIDDNTVFYRRPSSCGKDRRDSVVSTCAVLSLVALFPRTRTSTTTSHHGCLNAGPGFERAARQLRALHLRLRQVRLQS